MTKNNLYMENDELRLYVDVQPLTFDALENSKNEAAASAENARQSAENASNALSSMIDYKNRLEIFYAQASDNLSSLLNNAIESIINTKNTVLSTIQTLGETVLNNINNTFNEVKNSIQTLGQSYVNQAKNYADEAKDIADNIVSLEHINQYKALETGDISSDNNVLPWIRKMNRSTFDRSKFTVVGSPNITDDGIASGFSSNQRILCNVNISSSDLTEYTILVKHKVPSKSERIISPIDNNVYSPLFTNVTTQTYCMFWRDQSNTTHRLEIPMSLFNTNDEILFKVVYSDTYRSMQYSKDYGTTWSESVVSTSTDVQSYETNAISLGNFGSNSGTSAYFTSSINLKYFSIKVDGVEVFSGNKTGIDTIKPDNYTVVGTPTISADGVASGFSSSNYITQSIDFSKPFKLKFKIKTPSSVPSSVQYFLLTSTRGLVCQYSTTGVLGIKASTTSWGDDLINTTFSAQTNTEYLIEIEWTGTNYTCKINGEQIYSNSSTSQVLAGGLEIGGYPSQDTSSFLGSIDLNAFKIYVDGNLVYQPCLKIPYTYAGNGKGYNASTGSKIVQSIYRDRVSDMYEQFGYAPYYTLSDTNFTLPQGELYGMIENLRKLIIERTSLVQGD